MPLPRSLENFLYPVDPAQPQVRTDKKMKVLALGLSRMGTDSLCQALQILGYDHVYHGFDVMAGGPPIRKAWSLLGRRKWGSDFDDAQPITLEDLDALLGHCEAVTDQPCACFALEILKAYPDAKVILNYRDVESWYRSVSATFDVLYNSWDYRFLSYFDTELYWRKQSFEYYRTGFFQGSTARNAKRVHNEHYAMVRGSVHPSRLLEWKVEDGWGPLCAFLGNEVPQKEFPNGNTPAQLMAKSTANTTAARRRAYRNLGLIVTLSVSLAIGLTRRFARKL